jgi:hypothetical protein
MYCTRSSRSWVAARYVCLDHSSLFKLWEENAAASPSIHEMRGSLQDLFMYFTKVSLYQCGST